MMLKHILSLSVVFIFFNANAFASTIVNPLNLAGTYQCHGHDKHDGDYKDATVILTLDSANSDMKDHYGAYRFQLTEPDGIQYKGEAAAHGSHLAIYFENTKELRDRGVGIAEVTLKKRNNGEIITEFRKFYYEPLYQGGGNGYEVCVKKVAK